MRDILLAADENFFKSMGVESEDDESQMELISPARMTRARRAVSRFHDEQAHLIQEAEDIQNQKFLELLEKSHGTYLDAIKNSDIVGGKKKLSADEMENIRLQANKAANSFLKSHDVSTKFMQESFVMQVYCTFSCSLR